MFDIVERRFGKHKAGRRRPSRADSKYGEQVATIDDVAAIALALPEVTQGERHGNLTWLFGKKVFAWDRPFSKADLKRFGDEKPPEGPILAVSVGDLAEKEAVLATHPDSFFTIPHFNGYAAILIKLNVVTEEDLREALTDGWLTCAPPDLARAYLDR
jgi:hypothetical protein